MEFLLEGTSIECDASEIMTRKIVQGAFVEFPSIGKLSRISCKRNSEATISKELKPKKSKIEPNSKLDLYDSVKGENIEVYSMVRVVKFTVVNLTHDHKAHKISTNCFTYAKLTMRFKNFPVLNDPRQSLL